MKKIFSLGSLKLKYNTKSDNFLRSSTKRFSTISSSSLSSRQSLNIEVIRDGYNVDLTRVDNSFSKLHRACLLNFDAKKISKYARKYPETINQIDNVAQCSPLHLCVVNGNQQLLKILLQNGGDINLLDGYGKTLLIKSIECSNELVQYLISNGADVNKSDSKYNNSPLHWAILNDYPKTIANLLNCTNIDVNKCNINGETPLHLISKLNKNLHIFISDFKKHKVDLDYQDIKGRTALFVACVNNNFLCLDALVKSGADINIGNHLGELPINIAKANGTTNIVQIFEENLNLKSFNNQEKQTINDNKLHDLNSLSSWPDSVSESEKSSFNKEKEHNNNFKLKNIINQLKFNEKNLDQASNLKFNEETNLKNEKLIEKKNYDFNIEANDENSEKESINKPFIREIFKKNQHTKHDLEEQNMDKNKNKLINSKTNFKSFEALPNDDFINQMKLLMNEKIDSNEEYDEILLENKQEIHFEKNEQVEKNNSLLNKNKLNQIIIFESDEGEVNDYKSNLLSNNLEYDNQIEIVYNKNKISSNKEVFYGLSDDEIETSFELDNFTDKQNENSDVLCNHQVSKFIKNESFIIDNKEKDLNDVDFVNSDSIEEMKKLENSLQELNLINNQVKHERENIQTEIISKQKEIENLEKNLTQQFEVGKNLHERSNQLEQKYQKISLENEQLIAKLNNLLDKISQQDDQQNKLKEKLNEVLIREIELKKYNDDLKLQFEQKCSKLNLLDNELKKSEENYLKLKEENLIVQTEMKVERDKYVEFLREEQKQMEEQFKYSLKLKQETCDYLNDELKQYKEFLNKKNNLVKLTEKEEDLLNRLNNLNEELNQNLKQVQNQFNKQLEIFNNNDNKFVEKFESEKNMFLSLIDKLNLLLKDLEQKNNISTNELTFQNNEFLNLMDDLIKKNIYNFFESKIEFKLNNLNELVEELKQELTLFVNKNEPKNDSIEKLNQSLNTNTNLNQYKFVGFDSDHVKLNEESSIKEKSLCNENLSSESLDDFEQILNEKFNKLKLHIEKDIRDQFNLFEKLLNKNIKINKNNKKIDLVRDHVLKQYSNALLESVGKNKYQNSASNLNYVKNDQRLYLNLEKLNQNQNEKNLLNFQLQNYQNSSNKLNILNQNLYLPNRKSYLNYSNDNLNESINRKQYLINNFYLRGENLDECISNLKADLGIYTK